MLNRGLMTSNSSEWETPQTLFDELDSEFHFTIDVCATAENTNCPRFLSRADDGLLLPWAGVCWMNPPYGRAIGEWVKKASQAKCLVVGLLPARTDTRWFHDYIYGKTEIRFIKGRIKFSGAKWNAPFPSMVVVWS